MKNLVGLSIALGTLVAPLALSTPSQAWYDCHCHIRPVARTIAYYKPVYYRVVRYRPVFTSRVVHHWLCHPVFHAAHAYAPYPDVFIEDAHVYEPPTYYYSPYYFSAHVLVHRSLEVGPLIHLEAPRPAVVTQAAYVLP